MKEFETESLHNLPDITLCSGDSGDSSMRASSNWKITTVNLPNMRKSCIFEMKMEMGTHIIPGTWMCQVKHAVICVSLRGENQADSNRIFKMMNAVAWRPASTKTLPHLLSLDSSILRILSLLTFQRQSYFISTNTLQSSKGKHLGPYAWTETTTVVSD